MALKSAAQGAGIVGKFDNGALKAVSVAFSGGSSPPPSYTPSLDFSDARNSQYIGTVF